jgi:imidazolonepropionase-like amidohydrolase
MTESFGRPRRYVSLFVCILLTFIFLPHGEAAPPPADPEYDIVILNSRVIDPESGLDAVRNIGISNGTIKSISEKSMRGRTNVLATGLVTAPGFIDLHSHGQDDENYRFKAMDGVTTALELEMGASPVERAYAETEKEGRPINYGFSVSWMTARTFVAAGFPRDTPAVVFWIGSAGQVFRMSAAQTRGADQFDRVISPGEAKTTALAIRREARF